MALHDHSYKLLFSHPQMVRHLLEGFVHEPWLAQLDFRSLEKANASFITDNLRARVGDLVWRVRWGDSWVYLYLLLEFQSRVEPYMAVRILTYVGLLFQDLIKAKRLPKGGRLPPVLPIVLYNGKERWSAPETLRSLLHANPGALSRYRMQARYLLIDVRRFRCEESAEKHNLAAMLFRLENSKTRTEVDDILVSLLTLLESPEQASLRHAFSVWVNRVILSRFPGGPLKEVISLQEMRMVLADRFYKLDAKVEAKIEAKAKANGRRDGMREGMREGIREGIREGKAELLLNLLRKRFGKLPRWVGERVQQAQAAQLTRWGARLLDVQSLDQLFRGRRRISAGMR
jgi:predicted transposase/invertase (TIGR01784 family)